MKAEPKRRARLLHVGGWWGWALCLAAAASRTTNPLLLALLVAVAALVVAARKTDAPWAGAFVAALRLGVFVIVLRLAFQIVFGAEIPGTVIVELPEVPLPEWAAGVRIGGSLTAPGLVLAFYDGLRLATIIACIGAANALTGPSRLLKSVPPALYEVGVALVVALSLAPQMVMDVGRVREARRLRGRPTQGARGVKGLISPVLDGSLRRSLDLAAAMDSRGYGRSIDLPPRIRRTTAALLLVGIVGVALGVYGLLDGGSPPLLGLPVLLVGGALAVVGMALGGRRNPRTRYRPDPWLIAECLVLACGVAAAAGVLATAARDPLLVNPSITPLVWPALPLLATVGILIGALPAVLAPPIPQEYRTNRDGATDDVTQESPAIVGVAA